MDANQVNLQPFVSMYRSHVDACRRWTDLLLSNAEKFEGLALRYARDAAERGFSAAEEAASGDPAASARAMQPDGKAVEEMMRLQREVASSMAEATQQMTRLMSEYTGSIARQMGAQVPGGMGTPPSAEAFVNFWSQASRQLTDMMQNWTQSAPQMMRNMGMGGGSGQDEGR